MAVGAVGLILFSTFGVAAIILFPNSNVLATTIALGIIISSIILISNPDDTIDKGTDSWDDE